VPVPLAPPVAPKAADQRRPLVICAAPSPPPWRRPSPSPPRNIGKLHRTGLKGPASARPAIGGRFSPAGAGAGLCHCVPRRLRLNPHQRAGARQCLACSRPEQVVPLVGSVGCVFARTNAGAMAKAIAFATVPHFPPQGRASKARPAPAPPQGGRYPPAGSGAGLCHLVPHRLRLNPHKRAGARRCLACSRPGWVAPFVACVGCVFTRTAL